MENILGSNKINNYIENIEDCLYIEDSFGRQIISGNYPNYKKEEFISGIQLAIKGKINNEGIFIFDDYLFYQNINSKNDFIFNTPPIKLKNKSDENYILFISNLKIGFPEEEIGFNESIRTLLVDFIQNRNNNIKELKNYSNKIKRIILLGSSLNTNKKAIEKKIIKDNSSVSSQEINNIILDNYIALNKFLKLISNYIYTDLMPSSDSNDDLLYPQKPLNKLLFSENNKNINNFVLNLVTNPYFFKLKLN